MSNYYWNAASTDGNLANAANWYPEPPVTGGSAVFSDGDNWYFGASGSDASSVSTGFNVLSGVTLGGVYFYANYQGAFGLPPQRPLEVTGITHSSTTATATTDVAHGYAAGDTVTVSGASDANYNGTFAVASVPTSTTFTYTTGSAPASDSTACTVIRRCAPIVPAGEARIGLPSLSGSSGGGAQRLAIDFGSSAVACTVTATATSGTDMTLEPVRLLFNNSSASLTVTGGMVGVATTLPDDTSTLGTVAVGGASTVLDLSAGVTYTTLTNSGATVHDYGHGSGRTLVAWSGQTYLFNDGGAFGTVQAWGGTVVSMGRPTSGAAITTLDVYGGLVDFSQNPQSLSLSTVNVRDGQLVTAYEGQLSAVGTWFIDLSGKSSFTLYRS